MRAVGRLLVSRKQPLSSSVPVLKSGNLIILGALMGAGSAKSRVTFDSAVLYPFGPAVLQIAESNEKPNDETTKLP